MFSVSGISSSDVWSVGAVLDFNHGMATPIAEHWNGSAWSVVSSPSTGTLGNLFWVDAIAANDVVAVGGSTPDSLIEQWNGAAWSIVPSPDVATTFNHLIAVTAFSPTDLWAVGEDRSGTNARQTLALHYRTAIKAGAGSVGSAHPAASSSGSIVCQHTTAGAASSTAGAFANPRWQLTRFLRPPSPSAAR